MAILAVLLCIFFVARNGTMRSVDAALSEWTSGHAHWAEGWEIEKGNLVKLTSPFLIVPKGTYTLSVDYSCEADENLTMTAPEGMHYFIHGGNLRLNPILHSVQTDFTVDEGIDNLVLELVTSGKGDVRITDVRIEQNRNDLGQICVFYVFGVLFFDFFLIQRKVWRREQVFAFYALLFFASLPLFMPGIQLGQDLRFHFMRLEGLWRALSTGQIPSRVQAAWFGGYGYPVSIYYGDILYYPSALMRMMGVPLVTAYKFYLFLVTYLTVLSTFVCFRRITGSVLPTVLVSSAYVLAHYRLYDVYIRAGVGEMSAFIFFPLILLGLWEMVRCPSFTFRLALRDGALIAVGLAGIICNHMLSGEITLITFALVCLLYLPQVIKKQGMVTLCAGAVLSVAIAAYFAVPFLDTYRSVEVAVSGSLSGGNRHMIQPYGAFLSQFFAFTEKIDGYSVEEARVRFALTPGPALMLTFVAGIAAVFLGKDRKRIWKPLLLATLMLWISSDLFPWNVLALRTRIGRILSQVQFPWRYLSMAVVFLSVLLAELLRMPICRRWKVEVAAVILGLCLYSTCDYLSQYISGATITKAWDMGEISDAAAMNYEYWREGADGALFTGEMIVSEGTEAEVLRRTGMRTELMCRTEGAGTVTLPQVNYGNMRAITDTGEQLTVTDGPNMQVMIAVPGGFSGKITCDYHEPLLWRLCEIFSLLGIICAVLLIFRGRKETGNVEEPILLGGQKAVVSGGVNHIGWKEP
ncbi:MAG: hypothetical protein IJ088_01975 [Clostridia bacterium]|nr:hypothetical protein [Clostridia bacterium]